MGTIAGFFYKICYLILTNPATGPIDPPAVVAPLAFALVNAATQAAAVVALTADLSLTASQRLVVVTIQQVDTFANTTYN